MRSVETRPGIMTLSLSLGQPCVVPSCHNAWHGSKCSTQVAPLSQGGRTGAHSVGAAELAAQEGAAKASFSSWYLQFPMGFTPWEVVEHLCLGGWRSAVECTGVSGDMCPCVHG
jgi:hypothetical protein